MAGRIITPIITCSLFVLVSRFSLLECTGRSLLQKYRKRTDTRHLPGAILFSLETRGLIACSAFCTVYVACYSWSYVPANGVCNLGVTKTLDDQNKITILPDGLEAATGWTTMGKIIWPVVHKVGPNGPDSLLYSDAVDVCAAYGTEIASPADLLAARALGYEFCACGWLSDATNGYVYISSTGCSLPTNGSTGVYICNNTHGNVYCRS